MSRRVLIIEVDDSTTNEELAALAPDVMVLGEVDSIDAAVILCDLAAA